MSSDNEYELPEVRVGEEQETVYENLKKNGGSDNGIENSAFIHSTTSVIVNFILFVANLLVYSCAV